MSYREKKRERALQIELFKIQQKYAFYTAFYSVSLGVSVSILLFALPFWLSSITTEKPIPIEWDIILKVYFIFGAILLAISTSAFVIIRERQNEEIGKIEREYLKEEW
ncbi:MAG: hypothetical protein OEY22_10720 [Candidatus Bathyarchaeota archaeon]|nr:hypothetical protein [Candidatus Bathyarchaeota archaeon]